MTSETQQKIVNFFSEYPSRVYTKGQILLHFDEPLHGVFYLDSGRVRQYNISDTGTEIVLNIYRSKNYFPVSIALTGANSEHIYEAMTKIEIRQAPMAEFMKFFTSSPDVILKLLKDQYVRTDKILKRMTYTMASTAYFRIIYELINECSFSKQKRDGSYQINLHEYQIAESAGLTRETASREFQKLIAKKIVKVSRRHIVVKDIDKLQSEIGQHI